MGQTGSSLVVLWGTCPQEPSSSHAQARVLPPLDHILAPRAPRERRGGPDPVPPKQAALIPKAGSRGQGGEGVHHLPWPSPWR